MRPLLVLTTALLAAGGGDVPIVPWSFGGPPDERWVTDQLADAIATEVREQREETLSAAEDREASDSVQIEQQAIDSGRLSLDRIFRSGDELFSHAFSSYDGFGPGTTKGIIHRVHVGVRGGLDGHSCSSCHAVGGPDGAGSEPENAFLEGDGVASSSTLVRNAPSLLGVGYVQSLAHQMTSALQLVRTSAIERAKRLQSVQFAKLTTHGVSFGEIAAHPDGTVNVDKLEGIDADLVVKPFGWKGTTASLRRFMEDASRLHFGVQSTILLQSHHERPVPELVGTGPLAHDPDADGVSSELPEGALTTGAAYLAMLESPIVMPPYSESLRDRWAQGSMLFSTLRCSSCHTEELPMLQGSWDEKSDTTGKSVHINLHSDGDKPKAGTHAKLFSDLKRHDMGSELADAREGSSGVKRSVWLTRPLWGLAESAPYLHDGRAATIPEAIVAHGGEARESQRLYLSSSEEQKRNLHVFLLSLSRAPRLRIAR
jgi:Di-haem oxidoreductase, putative peroxidase